MPRWKEQKLACWGNWPVVACRAARPEKVADLDRALGDRAVETIIPRGMGRSYGDASLNESGGVVLHERLNRMLAFEEASGILECEAGVTIGEVIDAFLPRGWFPPVTPGTKFVSLGGAIAADVHGKNHHSEGSIGAFVESFTLVTAGGSRLTCSRAENSDVFFATVGGMGLTGAIERVRLRLKRVESGYAAVQYRKARDLDHTLELFAGDFSGHRYSVAWIDCLSSGRSLGRSVLMAGDHASAGECPAPALSPRRKGRRSVPFFAPNFALNSFSCRAFNAVYYGVHSDGRKVVSYDDFFYPLDHVLHWNRLYGRRGFQQYQFVIPPGESRAGLVAILEKLARSGRASFLAVLKTLGPESGGLLSFPMPGWTLTLDLPNSTGTTEFLQGLDQDVLKHSGRRYLAKDASLRREDFERMYPRLGEFRAIKRRLDPAGRLSSSLSRRLGLT